MQNAAKTQFEYECDLAIERRDETRIPCRRYGLLYISKDYVQRCTIRDISLRGAKIETQSKRTLPEQMWLVDVETNTSALVKTAWVHGDLVGLEFINTSKDQHSPWNDAPPCTN